MPPLAHVGGVPVEETLPTLMPAVAMFGALLGARCRAWAAARTRASRRRRRRAGTPAAGWPDQIGDGARHGAVTGRPLAGDDPSDT